MFIYLLLIILTFYFLLRLMEFFKNHQEIHANQHKPLLHLLDMVEMTNEAAPTWHNLSAKSVRDYPECEGEQAINWKERTYATILDILMVCNFFLYTEKKFN